MEQSYFQGLLWTNKTLWPQTLRKLFKDRASLYTDCSPGSKVSESLQYSLPPCASGSPMICHGAKVLNVLLPSALGRSCRKRNQTPHVTDRDRKITLCLLCQNPTELITNTECAIPFQATYRFRVIEIPVLSFPLLSVFLSRFTDLT